MIEIKFSTVTSHFKPQAKPLASLAHYPSSVEVAALWKLALFFWGTYVCDFLIIGGPMFVFFLIFGGPIYVCCSDGLFRFEPHSFLMDNDQVFRVKLRQHPINSIEIIVIRTEPVIEPVKVSVQ